MRYFLVVLIGTVLAAATAVPAAAADATGEEPSLEYRPPRPVVPEPRAPTPAPPVAIFREEIGGFGMGAGSFNEPVDVAFDRDGGLLVLDAGNNRVQRFDSSGNLTSSWGSSGSRSGEFRAPGAIAVSPDGAIFVVDTGNHRVQKFDDQGNFLLQWGSLGSRAGDFKYPRDLDFDGDGNVWVVDAGNERVQKFDPFGRPLAEFGSSFGSRGGVFTGLVSVAWSDDRFGYIYLLGAGCLVQQFELDGTLVASWSAVGPDQEACEPGRMESDNRYDYLYLVDAGNALFERFTRDGRFLSALGGAARPFNAPRGLALEEDRGDYAVADTGNNIVQKFTLR